MNEQKTVNWRESAWRFVKCEKDGCMQKAGHKCITVGGSKPGSPAPSHAGRVQAFQDFWNANKDNIDPNDERIVYEYAYFDYDRAYGGYSLEESLERHRQRAKAVGALTMLRGLLGEEDWLDKIADMVIQGGINLEDWVPDYFK